MRVVLASGARFHAYHLARELAKYQMLATWYTWSSSRGDSRVLSPGRVRTDWLGKALNYLYNRTHFAHIVARSDWYVFSDQRFDRWLARQIGALSDDTIFVGWAHYVLESIPKVCAQGAKVILEMGSAHILTQQQILAAEFHKHGGAHTPIHPKNIDRMLEEYENAHYIMTPSSFARSSFLDRGFAPEKVLQVPYGVDDVFFTISPQNNKKYTVLFVGSVSFCKGAVYLLEAWEKIDIPLKESQLLIVGAMRREMRDYLASKTIKQNIHFLGGVSQETLRELYGEASVFVLPSLQDGFGLVVSQAMAAGLPVVCTTHTGAQDLIDHSSDGFVVDPYDSNALARYILYCFEHRDVARKIGQRARKKMRSYTWDDYGRRIRQVYRQL